MPELTLSEVLHLVSMELATLDEIERQRFYRFAVPAFRVVYECAGASGAGTSSAWVVAQLESVVLAYDEDEDEFGIGTLQQDGRLTHWGTYGERLSWSLREFPSLR